MELEQILVFNQAKSILPLTSLYRNNHSSIRRLISELPFGGRFIVNKEVNILGVQIFRKLVLNFFYTSNMNDGIEYANSKSGRAKEYYKIL